MDAFDAGTVLVGLGLFALGALSLGLYFLFRMPKGMNLPLYCTSKFKMALFWIDFLIRCNFSKFMNYAERYHEFIDGMTHLFQKEGVVYLPYFLGNLAVVFHAEHLEKLYKSSNTHSKEVFFLRDCLHTGLITNDPPSWNVRRRANNPAFNVPILDQFIGSMNKHARNLVKVLQNKADVDPDHAVTECCYNIIVECFTGVDPSKMKIKFDLEFIKIAEVLFAGRLVKPLEWFAFYYYKAKHGKEQTRIMEYAERSCSEIINTRIETIKKQGDFIEFLKKGHEKKNLIFLDNLLYHVYVSKLVDEAGMKDEVKTIVAAATDAPIFGFIYSIYMIGLHPEVQRKIQEEVDAIFGDGDPFRDLTIEDVKNMRYSEMAIKEAMRLYPPIFISNRLVTEDLNLGNNMTLPKGTSVLIPFHGLHRDSRYFPDPEKYDPERFRPENCGERHPYAYLPFSGGQRNCIGQRFAMMEMKISLAHLMKQCNLRSLHQRDQVVFESRLSLRSSNPGVHLEVTSRAKEPRREAVYG